jgi:hypothetical protein
MPSIAPTPRSRREEQAQLAQALAASLGVSLDEQELQLNSASTTTAARGLTPPSSPSREGFAYRPRSKMSLAQGEFC